MISCYKSMMGAMIILIFYFLSFLHFAICSCKHHCLLYHYFSLHTVHRLDNKHISLARLQPWLRLSHSSACRVSGSPILHIYPTACAFLPSDLPFIGVAAVDMLPPLLTYTMFHNLITLILPILAQAAASLSNVCTIDYAKAALLPTLQESA